MRAAIYDKFQGPIDIQNVPDPIPEKHGVVIKVEATGLCRSDWHGWMGHDPDITLPHVPGHELAGTIEETGSEVQLLSKGDRVTLPFVCGCGSCPQCASGNHQVCDNQFQPGFTHWGSFAQYVSIHYADINVVKLPEEIDFVTAASLGCRFITTEKDCGRRLMKLVDAWVAVHGCGGVGLSAIMIANAMGANVIAIDINNEKLELAKSVGAVATVNVTENIDVVETVKKYSEGGVHVSIDGLGSQETCFNSISNLRKRGKHIQVGLMVADYNNPKIPMGIVLANELEILGSHGMQAHQYKPMFEMIKAGKLSPEKLVSKTISLEESCTYLPDMNSFKENGVAVINTF